MIKSLSLAFLGMAGMAPQAVQLPEPVSMALWGLGLLAISGSLRGVIRRRSGSRVRGGAEQFVQLQVVDAR